MSLKSRRGTPAFTATLAHSFENVPGKVWTVNELGGPAKVSHFCIPAGIGDASWVYSKLSTLSRLTGREVLISMPDEAPRRGP
jgi:hypothetical protein